MIRRFALPLLLLPLGAGCATKGDVADLRATLLAELRSDRAQRDSLITEMRELRSVLLDSLSSAERRGLTGRVDLQRQVDQLNQQLAQLIQLTGETQRQLALMREAGGLESGGVTGERPAAVGTPGGDGDGDGEGEDVGPAAEASEPEALYNAALGQFRRGSYATARAGLDEFLQRFPSHDLAPDAQFYKAETWAREEDPDAALREYARVLELFPNSRRAPSALYKSGQIERQRGNVDDARTFFERVAQGYPDSDEAPLAREALSRLRGG